MTDFNEVIPDFVPLATSSIERIKDCISWLSPEGKILYANHQGCKALGYTQEEIGELMIWQIDRSYTPALWAQHFARLRELGSSTFETWHIRKNGTVMPVEINANYIHFNGKEYNCAIVRDITARKQAETLDQIRAEVLEIVAESQHLDQALQKLAEGVEKYDPNMLAAIVLNRYNETEVFTSRGLPAESMPILMNLRLGHDAALDEELAQLGLGPVLSKNLEFRNLTASSHFFIFRQAGTHFSPEDRSLWDHFSRLTQIAIEQSLAAEELRLSATVFRNSSEGMLVMDSEGHILQANQAFTAMSGHGLNEVIGRHPIEFVSSRNNENLRQEIEEALMQRGYWQGEIWEYAKSGQEYLKQVKINAVSDERNQPYRIVALFSDITEKKKSEERIWFEANFDALTQLPNRRLFKERLEQEILKAERANEQCALFFIDLDRFKEVNDSVGHVGGDMLLVEVARRLTHVVRTTDTVARLGGDEFTVILPGLGDFDAITRIADSIIEGLEMPFNIKEQVHYISASIGVTLYPHDAQNVDHLIRNADQAMYSAKNLGRSRFCYFTESMQLSADRRSHQTRDLRRAVKLQEFHLHYQPIVNLQTGRINKAEALVRWQHPHHGLVNPADFIPLAEETGLIHELGDWIFNAAIEQAKAWKNEFEDGVRISVNLSPVQFLDPSFFEQWLSKMNEIGLPGENICIEITEGILLETEMAANELMRFQRNGIQIAIDDFGMGYSSLAYIKQLDVDYLKIDKSFIKSCKSSTADLSLVEAIVVMAHKLGLYVVAEGVETEGQLQLLQDIGCDYGQGYFFSRPLPPHELEQWAINWQKSQILVRDVPAAFNISSSQPD